MKQLLNLCVATILVAGCALGPSRDSKEMDALVGKVDKAYFVSKYGPPDRQTRVSESVDHWEYRLTWKYSAPTSADGFLTYDRIRLTFNRGLLTSWSGAGVND